MKSQLSLPRIEDAMRRAIEISELGLGLTSPNPIVGALLLDIEGNVIGEGFHLGANGGKHAEVIAIENAGARASGATLVLTLEPCNHHGKTPPCSEAIIKAGIERVIFAVSDPNHVAQGGAKRLREAGITVESGLLEKEVRFSNRAWLTKVEKSRPYITVKVAATLDGKIAARDGSAKWITSEESRADVAKLRSQCDAIVTGTGTVIADNPSLTVRNVARSGQFRPVRVVLGERKIDSSSNILDTKAPTKLLQTRDLGELIKVGVESGWNRIMVEAGPTLTSAIIGSELFDELFIYQAPTLLGGTFDFTKDLSIDALVDRIDLELIDTQIIEGAERNLRIHCLAKNANRRSH